MYKYDLALDNLEGMICHKIKLTNQPTKNHYDVVTLFDEHSNEQE